MPHTRRVCPTAHSFSRSSCTNSCGTWWEAFSSSGSAAGLRCSGAERLPCFRNGVWVAYAITLIGLVLLTLQNRRHAGLEPGPYRPGQERDSGVTDKDAAGVDSDDTESDPAALDGIVDSETTADERPATSPSQPTAQG